MRRSGGIRQRVHPQRPRRTPMQPTVIKDMCSPCCFWRTLSMSQRMGDALFISPVSNGTSKRAPAPRREYFRSEDRCAEIQGESEESQPADPTDDAGARDGFWSIQGYFIYRHHTEPRVQLYVLQEETFHIPLKYIDVTRSAHTWNGRSTSKIRYFSSIAPVRIGWKVVVWLSGMLLIFAKRPRPLVEDRKSPFERRFGE